MILGPFEPALLVNPVLSSWEPRPDVRTWDWICENGRMHNGQPFDGDRVPWLEGVCDAYDDPITRTISLMWGTRLGKTSGAFQIMACMMSTAPMPGLYSSSTQSLVKRAVTGKIYPILKAIDATREQLLSESTEKIRLQKSTWHVAWSGSATALADIEAYYGHAGEIDKWSFNELQGGDAGEGDPLDQWDERFKEYWESRKQIYECSPSTARKSRINKKVMASNNCRFQVACPRCRSRQVLKMGGADSAQTGGILFDKNTDGSLDVELARTTARYVCEHCRKEIYDEQRFRMMRGGVWVPEGCHADKRGRVLGTPKRSPRDWGSQLSSLYSLQMRWGDMAAKFVASRSDPRALQMFVNGWEAKVWEPYRVKSEPEQVAERLTTETAFGVIPAWATWLFASIDVQQDHFVACVEACGPDERTHTVAHYQLASFEEIERKIVFGEFEHEDAMGPLSPVATAIDCGFRPRDVYRFCQAMRKKLAGTSRTVVAVKGANNDCAGEPFEIKIVARNKNLSEKNAKILAARGRLLIRIRVSPYYYEPIIQEQLEEGLPGVAGGHSLHAEAINDMDFVRQLCNGAEAAEPSKMDPNRHLWVKRWANEPNDYRDCRKYARCLMDWKFDRDWRKADKRQPSVNQPRKQQVVATTSGSVDQEPERQRGKFRPTTRRSMVVEQ